MRKVILQIDVTLDGFSAASDGSLDWVTADEAMNREATDLLDTVDTILLGRVAYQAFVAYWPFADMNESTTAGRITRQLNEATKIVFSKTLQQVEWGTWNNAQLIHDNIPQAITDMKALPGKNLLLYAGAKIISTFIRSDLIDEYRLRIHPVLLGQGQPLFQGIDNHLDLKLIRTQPYKNGAVLLEYHRA
ncbi:MAG: dihydrofolate reductase family protein [Chloroflexota bacterium]